MKNITLYSVPDEVNTIEKTIAWLQKKFRNNEKFSIRIDEHITFENIDTLPTSTIRNDELLRKTKDDVLFDNTFHDGRGNCGECYPDGNCRYGV